jgi:hypothetical protein
MPEIPTGVTGVTRADQQAGMLREYRSEGRIDGSAAQQFGFLYRLK